MEFDSLIALTLDPSISSLAVRLYSLLRFKYLNRQTGRCDPRQARLATDLGVSDRAIRSALSELVAGEYMTVTQRRYSSDYGFSTRKYSSGLPIPARKHSSGQPGSTVPGCAPVSITEPGFFNQKDNVRVWLSESLKEFMHREDAPDEALMDQLLLLMGDTPWSDVKLLLKRRYHQKFRPAGYGWFAWLFKSEFYSKVRKQA